MRLLSVDVVSFPVGKRETYNIPRLVSYEAWMYREFRLAYLLTVTLN